ncbi:MAG: phosphatase PAP2 family protein [Magnetospirillum sp.]|nr:phosphatase PAP2 family protein [Magnetospirillum sp.]
METRAPTGLVSRLWASMQRHPWLWSLGLMAPLVMFPQIDLTVSSWFYDPAGRFFPARIAAFPEWVRLGMPRVLFTAALLIVAAWAAGEWLRQPIFGITRRVAAYVVLSLALGPGLVVNLILKDNWGRPRPSTIQEFGGPNVYVPPLVVSDQCNDNCSFASGHGALGFWPVALALLAPAPWRRPAMAAALAFGAMVGVVRIAQGGHFLSDVIASAIITIGINIMLYRWFIGPAEGRSSKNNPSIPGESA